MEGCGLRVPAPRETHPSSFFSLFLLSEACISPKIHVSQINQIDQIGKHLHDGRRADLFITIFIERRHYPGCEAPDVLMPR